MKGHPMGGLFYWGAVINRMLRLPSLCSGILEWGASTSLKTSGFPTYFLFPKGLRPLIAFLQNFALKQALCFIFRNALSHRDFWKQKNHEKSWFLNWLAEREGFEPPDL
jgi:hypothetical protein